MPPRSEGGTAGRAEPASRRGSRWGGPWALVLALVAPGCGKTMSDADCQKVADHILEVWNVEAKKKTPTDPGAADKAAPVIRAEGEKAAGDFLSECKQELTGRRVNSGEMDCVLAAQTISAINECGRTN